MKHFWKIAGIAGVLSAAISFSAFAAEWKEDGTGYYWQEDDGSYPKNQWKWIDGNGDGISECYYFDGNGYMAASTFVNGYQVNENGAWVQNGTVQTRKSWALVKNSNDPMEILKAVTEQNNAVDAIDMDFFMNMQLGMDGQTLDMNMNGDMKVKNALSDQLQFIMNMDLSLLGQSMSTSAFYTDGWYYYDMDGQKYKTQMDYSSAYQSALSSTEMVNLTAADDYSYIKDISMARNGDSITLYYTADGAQLMDAVNQALSAMDMSLSDMGLTMNISAYKGEITIDPDGNYKQQRALMQMQMNLEDQSGQYLYEGDQYTIDFSMFMEANIKAMGDAVQMTLPSTAEYQDLTAAMNGALSGAGK